MTHFYPRPPRGGRLLQDAQGPLKGGISIHALREEGDRSSSTGGTTSNEFLSTPSARRATSRTWLNPCSQSNFYPRPPRGGRHRFEHISARIYTISIHALREEGDARVTMPSSSSCIFLSTPSARRATQPYQFGHPYTKFLSTPSARRATFDIAMYHSGVRFLSTPSARRATCWMPSGVCFRKFLSTPSARRAT